MKKLLRTNSLAAYRANHRRVTGERGKQLLRRRSEVAERAFAHTCDTCGWRRTWLRGIEKVQKRYLISTMSDNLGLILQTLIGTSKPRAFLLAQRSLSWCYRLRPTISFIPQPILDGSRSGSPFQPLTFLLFVFSVLAKRSFFNRLLGTSRRPLDLLL